MKNTNDFMNQIKALDPELIVSQDDISGIIFAVTPNHVELSLPLNPLKGKSQKFSKILGGDYTPSEELGVFRNIRFLAYQVRCEYDGKIINVFFVSPDYEGTFEKARLPKNVIQKSENYWKLQNVKIEVLSKKEEDLSKFEANKGALILKLTQYMTLDQKNEIIYYLGIAIGRLKANDERARRGLYFVGQEKMKISTRRIGLFNFGIENKLLMDELQSPENLMLVYEYLVTVMKFEDPDFEEPTREEIFQSEQRATQEITPVMEEPIQEPTTIQQVITPDGGKVEFLKLGLSGKIETLQKLGILTDEVIDVLLMAESLSCYENWKEMAKMDIMQLLDTDMSKQEIKGFLKASEGLKKYELI